MFPTTCRTSISVERMLTECKGTKNFKDDLGIPHQLDEALRSEITRKYKYK